jgi:hypothetical protein
MRRRTLWALIIPSVLALFLAVTAVLRMSLDTPLSTLASPRTFIIPPRVGVAELGIYRPKPAEPEPAAPAEGHGGGHH